jgi:hypothetical protein
MVSAIFHIRFAVFDISALHVGLYLLSAVVSGLASYGVSALGTFLKERWRQRRRRTVCREREQGKIRAHGGEGVDAPVDRSLSFDWPPKGEKPKSDGLGTETVEKQRHDEDKRRPRRRRPR